MNSNCWFNPLLRWLVPLLLLLGGEFVQAQATRTWVSGVGDDANPCSRTAPCQTLAGALSKTASGGEIDALDPGAFDWVGDNATTATYTPLVITQPVTIDGGAGHVSSLGPLSPIDPNFNTVTLLANQDAIVVNLPPGATGEVILRNLSLNGNKGMGRNGIRIASAGPVSINNVTISQFAQNCLLVDSTASSATVDIVDSTFTLCATGVQIAGSSTVEVSHSSSGNNSSTDFQTTVPTATLFAAGNGSFGSPQGSSLLAYTGTFPGVPAGSATATVSGGSAGCAFASQQFVAPASVGSGPPTGSIPVQAGLQFTTTNCGANSIVSITIQYPQALPPGVALYKYGPATAGAVTSSWFAVPGAQISADRLSVTYTVTDNGPGDSNPAVGFITDPAIPLIVPSAPIPALSSTGVAWLSCLLALAALRSRSLRVHIRRGLRLG